MKARSSSSKATKNKSRAKVPNSVVKLPIKSSLKKFGSAGMRQPRWQGAGGDGSVGKANGSHT